MKRILLVLAIAGCGKADDALKALEGVKAEACGCKPTDAACQQAALTKIADWHAKHDETPGAKSQSAKATAHLEEIVGCQTDQALAAIPAAYGCGELDDAAKAKQPWCLVAGWGDAKAVKPADLPFGKTLTGTFAVVELGKAVSTEVGPPMELQIEGNAEAPTADNRPMTAAGKGWTFSTSEGEPAIELRKVDGGWVTLETVGDKRMVSVLSE